MDVDDVVTQEAGASLCACLVELSAGDEEVDAETLCATAIATCTVDDPTQTLGTCLESSFGEEE